MKFTDYPDSPLSLTERHMVFTQCKRQNDLTITAVTNLDAAYRTAKYSWGSIPTRELFKVLAILVTPDKGYYRRTNVHFASLCQVLPAEFIERAMDNWLEVFDHGREPADEMYKYFQEIHPFSDGNGRMGWLMYLIYRARTSGSWELLDSPRVEFNFSPAV